jgi:drug/metabolite transporter (DMT)-like permease
MTRRDQGPIVVASLAAVYLIWGSTYLALRFGLEGFPPFLLNGLRFIIAGTLLYVVLRLRGAAPPTRRQWWNAGRMGALLLVGGVGSMTLAEDFGVGSGVAATAAAVIPVWAALISGFFGRWPVRREWLGLIIGMIGVLFLLQEADFRTTTAGTILVIVGPLLWAFGSVWGSRIEMPEGLMTPATQLVSAGVLMLSVSRLLGENVAEAPPLSSWAALVYLLVMGSLVAYVAYVHLLRTVRPSLATSYAYVNPIVAVILGLTLGAEVITGAILIALPLILIGVGLVATVGRKSSPETARSTRTPLEEAA